jgi:hypothetical protein
LEYRSDRLFIVVNCIYDAALVLFSPFKLVSGFLSGHFFEYLLRGN